MENLLSFVEKYLGKSQVGDTSENEGQCVGLIEEWILANNHPHIWGNAVDLMKNADPSHYSIVENGPTNYPPAGAIICWGSSWGGGYGHTAVVLAATPDEFVAFEQNNPEGSPPIVATHTYSGVAGWIILK